MTYSPSYMIMAHTEDDTFKVLRRKVSYAIMKKTIRAIRWEHNTEPYEVTDKAIRKALADYGWDFVDFFMDGRHD